MLKTVHNRESKFYEMFTNDHLCLPEMYGIENEKGLILMQDLGQMGTNADFFDGCRFEQAVQVTLQLARFHAHCLQKVDAEEMLLHFPSNRKPLLSNFGKVIAHCGGGMRAKHPEMLDCAEFDLLSLFFDSATEFMKRSFGDAHEILGMKPILSQGDMWIGNLMWQKDCQGKASDKLVGIIDFQTAHTGSCGEDLARMMVACMDGDLRRDCELDILDIYTQELQRRLKAEYGADLPFTAQEIKAAYEFVFPMQTMLVMFCSSFLLQTLDGEEDELMAIKKTNKVLMRIRDAVKDSAELLSKHGHLQWLLQQQADAKNVATTSRCQQFKYLTLANDRGIRMRSS